MSRTAVEAEYYCQVLNPIYSFLSHSQTISVLPWLYHFKVSHPIYSFISCSEARYFAIIMLFIDSYHKISTTAHHCIRSTAILKPVRLATGIANPLISHSMHAVTRTCRFYAPISYLIFLLICYLFALFDGLSRSLPRLLAFVSSLPLWFWLAAASSIIV